MSAKAKTPIEETWTPDLHNTCHDRVTVQAPGPPPVKLRQKTMAADEARWNEYHASRAKLAAAAPEMARLLMELRYVDVEHGGAMPIEICASCQNRSVGEPEPGSVGRPVTHYFNGEHAPDCKLMAVLRKAGVMP